MDFLASKRFITTSLVILVLLNLTLLGILWVQNFSGKHSPVQVKITRQYNRQIFFNAPLALTEKQADSFQELRREHFRKVRPEMQAISLLKEQLVKEAIRENPDSQKIAQLAQAIGKHQSSIEQQLATHFHQLSEVCTPSQRDSLQKILMHMGMRQMHMRKDTIENLQR
ncbi:MAG: periplasmic heavy metal sensor [Chlorobiaceae bacterium]|jgi:Spy/CpxP family protein refolding chaperone|nr:periplasmic heavy metal sensor [Chlorobiaceae bacterium]